MKNQLRKTLCELSALIGPTGGEGRVADYIENRVKGHVDTVTRDAMGNLICVKKGSGKKLMFAAHMDQIGVCSTAADDKGFIRYTTVGGLSPETLYGSTVEFTNGVRGVVGRETDAPDPKLAHARMFVDIGAKTRDEAVKLLPIGTFGAPVAVVSDLNGLLAGPAMDDRAGCAVLLELLLSLPETDAEVIAVFSTQEEVGLRGANAAAWAHQPDIGISLDVTLVGDTPKCAVNACKLGEGVAVKVLDGGMISNPKLVAHLCALAEQNSITYQREVLTGGTTDARAIQLAGAGVPSCCLSIPTRYVHSWVEVVDMDDMLATLTLAQAVTARPE